MAKFYSLYSSEKFLQAVGDFKNRKGAVKKLSSLKQMKKCEAGGFGAWPSTCWRYEQERFDEEKIAHCAYFRCLQTFGQ